MVSPPWGTKGFNDHRNEDDQMVDYCWNPGKPGLVDRAKTDVEIGFIGVRAYRVVEVL